MTNNDVVKRAEDSIYNNKLNDFLFDNAKLELDGLTSKEQKILGMRIKNSLFGGKDQDDNKPLGPNTEKSRFIHDVFSKYSEILSSYDAMEMIALFVRQFPNYKSYKSKGVTKTRYLKYHIENYLNETYIFNLRITTFLNEVKKSCKEKQTAENVAKIEKLTKVTKDTMSSLDIIRGRHVHKKRYSDNKLDQLESLELMVRDGELKKKLGWFKDLQYRFTRNDWHKTITNNNRALNKLIRFVMDEIAETIIDELYPRYN